MKQTVNFTKFEQAFKDYGRSDNFSHEGLIALFDYLEDLESASVLEMELDVIGICCEYSEYKDFADFQMAYGPDYESIDDVGNETTVIPINDESFIILSF